MREARTHCPTCGRLLRCPNGHEWWRQEGVERMRKVTSGKVKVTKVRKRKTTKSTKIHPTNQVYKTFRRIARVMGEIEAGLSALFDVLEQGGLMRAPGGQVVEMSAEDAERVLTQAKQITSIMSYAAKSVVPCLMIAVGDPSALRAYGLAPRTEPPEDETVH